MKSSCTSSFLTVNVKRGGKVDVLKRKGKNTLCYSGGGDTPVLCHSGCLVSFRRTPLLQHLVNPHITLLELGLPQLGWPTAGNAVVRVLGCALPLVRVSRHQVRRQECLT